MDGKRASTHNTREDYSRQRFITASGAHVRRRLCGVVADRMPSSFEKGISRELHVENDPMPPCGAAASNDGWRRAEYRRQFFRVRAHACLRGKRVVSQSAFDLVMVNQVCSENTMSPHSREIMLCIALCLPIRFVGCILARVRKAMLVSKSHH